MEYDAVVQVFLLHPAPAQDARCALPSMPQQCAELHIGGV